jgi:hypothetical protein
MGRGYVDSSKELIFTIVPDADHLWEVLATDSETTIFKSQSRSVENAA